MSTEKPKLGPNCEDCPVRDRCPAALAVIAVGDMMRDSETGSPLGGWATELIEIKNLMPPAKEIATAIARCSGPIDVEHTSHSDLLGPDATVQHGCSVVRDSLDSHGKPARSFFGTTIRIPREGGVLRDIDRAKPENVHNLGPTPYLAFYPSFSENESPFNDELCVDSTQSPDFSYAERSRTQVFTGHVLEVVNRYYRPPDTIQQEIGELRALLEDGSRARQRFAAQRIGHLEALIDAINVARATSRPSEAE